MFIFQGQISENGFPRFDSVRACGPWPKAMGLWPMAEGHGPWPMAAGHGLVSIQIGYVPGCGMARGLTASHSRSASDMSHDVIRGQYVVVIGGCWKAWSFG